MVTPPDTNRGTQIGLDVKYDNTQATSEATSGELFPGVRRLMIRGAIPACNSSSATPWSPLARLDRANAADCTTVDIGDCSKREKSHSQSTENHKNFGHLRFSYINNAEILVPSFLSECKIHLLKVVR